MDRCAGQRLRDRASKYAGLAEAWQVQAFGCNGHGRSSLVPRARGLGTCLVVFALLSRAECLVSFAPHSEQGAADPEHGYAQERGETGVPVRLQRGAWKTLKIGPDLYVVRRQREGEAVASAAALAAKEDRAELSAPEEGMDLAAQEAIMMDMGEKEGPDLLLPSGTDMGAKGSPDLPQPRSMPVGAKGSPDLPLPVGTDVGAKESPDRPPPRSMHVGAKQSPDRPPPRSMYMGAKESPERPPPRRSSMDKGAQEDILMDMGEREDGSLPQKNEHASDILDVGVLLDKDDAPEDANPVPQSVVPLSRAPPTDGDAEKQKTKDAVDTLAHQKSPEAAPPKIAASASPPPKMHMQMATTSEATAGSGGGRASEQRPLPLPPLMKSVPGKPQGKDVETANEPKKHGEDRAAPPTPAAPAVTGPVPPLPLPAHMQRLQQQQRQVAVDTEANAASDGLSAPAWNPNEQLSPRPPAKEIPEKVLESAQAVNTRLDFPEATPGERASSPPLPPERAMGVEVQRSEPRGSVNPTMRPLMRSEPRSAEDLQSLQLQNRTPANGKSAEPRNASAAAEKARDEEQDHDSAANSSSPETFVHEISADSDLPDSNASTPPKRISAGTSSWHSGHWKVNQLPTMAELMAEAPTVLMLEDAGVKWWTYTFFASLPAVALTTCCVVSAVKVPHETLQPQEPLELRAALYLARGGDRWILMFMLCALVACAATFFGTIAKLHTMPLNQDMPRNAESPGERAFEAGGGVAVSLSFAYLVMSSWRANGKVQITSGLMGHYALRGALFAAAAALGIECIGQIGYDQGAKYLGFKVDKSMQNLLVCPEMFVLGMSQECSKTMVLLSGCWLSSVALHQAGAPGVCSFWWRSLIETPRAMMLAGLSIGFGFMAMENITFLVSVSTFGLKEADLMPTLYVESDLADKTLDAQKNMEMLRAMTVITRVLLNIHPWLTGIVGARIGRIVFKPPRQTPQITWSEFLWCLGPSALAHATFDTMMVLLPGPLALFLPPAAWLLLRGSFRGEWDAFIDDTPAARLAAAFNAPASAQRAAALQAARRASAAGASALQNAQRGSTRAIAQGGPGAAAQSRAAAPAQKTTWAARRAAQQQAAAAAATHHTIHSPPSSRQPSPRKEAEPVGPVVPMRLQRAAFDVGIREKWDANDGKPTARCVGSSAQESVDSKQPAPAPARYHRRPRQMPEWALEEDAEEEEAAARAVWLAQREEMRNQASLNAGPGGCQGPRPIVRRPQGMDPPGRVHFANTNETSQPGSAANSSRLANAAVWMSMADAEDCEEDIGPDNI